MATDLDIYRATIAGVPLPRGSKQITSPLVTPVSIEERLRHFSEAAYNLNSESLLVRFCKVLLGDAGLGQARKREILLRLQAVLTGTHFYDLDRFWGSIFGLPRFSAEQLGLTPTDRSTIVLWQDARSRDNSYRSRIMAFARGVQYGGSPIALELVAEAMLGVDVAVYEHYETGTDRWRYTVRPRKILTLEEKLHLRRVLRKLAPPEAELVLENGSAVFFTPVPLSMTSASSEYWQVVGSYEPSATAPHVPGEQPRPPFSDYQGEAWSYVPELAAVSAYAALESGAIVETNTKDVVVSESGRIVFFDAARAIISVRSIMAGRFASEGVVAAHPIPTARQAVDDIIRRQGASESDAHPYADTAVDPLSLIQPVLGEVFVDGVPITEVTNVDSQAHEDPVFWATPRRESTDPMREVLEVRLRTTRRINYVSAEVAKFPSVVTVQGWNLSQSTWTDLFSYAVGEAYPERFIPQRIEDVGHPQHYSERHWANIGQVCTPITTDRIRFVIVRQDATGVGPFGLDGQPVPYSLAIRNADVGYRVRSWTDIPRDQALGGTTDPWGSQITYQVRHESAIGLLDEEQWRCEPQPSRDAVVALYADMRGTDGEGQIVDAFWMDPTHTGPRFNLYWSNDDPPEGNFLGLDEPLDESFITEQAIVEVANGLQFGNASTPAFTVIDNEGIRFDPVRDFWFGIQVLTNWPSVSANYRPIIDLGEIRVWVQGEYIWIDSDADGVTLTVPAAFPAGTRLTLIVSRADGHLTAWAQAGNAADLTTRDHLVVGTPAPVSDIIFGQGPGGTEIADFVLAAFVLKEETITADAVEEFFDDPRMFSTGPDYLVEDKGQINAFLRYSITRGWVGGPLDRYANLTWSPILRDYVLEKGVVRVPTTQARYWKIEFTHLVPEPYEVFIPQQRDMLLFPTGEVRAHDDRAQGTDWAEVPGVQAAVQTAQGVGIPGFASEGTILSNGEIGRSPTEVLVPADPEGLAALRRDSGGVGFEDHHIGGTIPRFQSVGLHQYRTQTVLHEVRLGYFVGLRSLIPAVMHQTEADDTEVVSELFMNLNGMEQPITFALDTGSLNTYGLPGGETTSVLYNSKSDIQSLQVAIAQSDPRQLVPNHFFTDSALLSNDWVGDDDWMRVGDAIPTYVPDRRVVRLDRAEQSQGSITVDALNLSKGLVFSGANGDIATSNGPDTYTGKIEAIFRISTDDWTPAADQVLLAQWAGVGNRSWFIRLNNTGRIAFINSTNGSTETTRTSTASVPSGSQWLRVRADPTNGTNSVLEVWASPDTTDDIGEIAWTQVGTTVNGTATTIFNSPAAPTSVGGKGDGTSPFIGRIERFLLYHEDVLVLAPDWTNEDQFRPGTKGGYDADGNLWMIQGGAYVDGNIGRLPHPLSWPVSRTTSQWVFSPDALEHLYGGLRSVEVEPSAVGFMTAAVRLTLLTDTTTPIKLQILGSDDSVLATVDIEGVAGQQIESYVTYVTGSEPGPPPIPPDYGIVHLPTPLTAEITAPDLTAPEWVPPEPTEVDDQVRIQVLQEGTTDDAWEVNALSLFDQPIVWEFSVDDGSTWVKAHPEVINNTHGLVTFNTPGNELRWRVSSYANNTHIHGVFIRPTYLGRPNTRPYGLQRGPMVSDFDQNPPITEDPVWKLWDRAVPRWWWSEFRSFPILSPTGSPLVTEDSRSLARTAAEFVTYTDVGTRVGIFYRSGTEDQAFNLDAVTQPGRNHGIAQELSHTITNPPPPTDLYRTDEFALVEEETVFTRHKVDTETFTFGENEAAYTPNQVGTEQFIVVETEATSTPNQMDTDSATLGEVQSSEFSFLDTTPKTDSDVGTLFAEVADVPEASQPSGDFGSLTESAQVTRVNHYDNDGGIFSDVTVSVD